MKSCILSIPDLLTAIPVSPATLVKAFGQELPQGSLLQASERRIPTPQTALAFVTREISN